MKSHTYYDILGVSRDATLDEITTAKMHWRKYIIQMQMHIKILTQPLLCRRYLRHTGFYRIRKSAANITKKHSAKPNAFSKHLH